MQTNQHRLNSDYQIHHNLAGSCSTPDGAWALMYGQKIDIESRLNAAEMLPLNRQILVAEMEEARRDHGPESSVYLKALRALKEHEAGSATATANIEGARREMETITQLMADLEPKCLYRNLPLLDRLESCKADETRGELMRRAENMMIGNLLGIPFDHIEAMREHPDFSSHILPSIMQTGRLIANAAHAGDQKMIEQALTPKPLFLKESIHDDHV